LLGSEEIPLKSKSRKQAESIPLHPLLVDLPGDMAIKTEERDTHERSVKTRHTGDPAKRSARKCKGSECQGPVRTQAAVAQDRKARSTHPRHLKPREGDATKGHDNDIRHPPANRAEDRGPLDVTRGHGHATDSLPEMIRSPDAGAVLARGSGVKMNIVEGVPAVPTEQVSIGGGQEGAVDQAPEAPQVVLADHVVETAQVPARHAGQNPIEDGSHDHGEGAGGPESGQGSGSHDLIGNRPDEASRGASMMSPLMGKTQLNGPQRA